MRKLALLLLLLGLAGCGDDIDEQFRLATLDSQGSLGMSLRELPRATLESIGLRYGLAVIKLGAAGERAGLRLGDVVYGVNQKQVASLQEFSKALAQPADGKLSLLVRRGKTDLYVPMDAGPGRPDGGVLRGPRPPTDTLLRT